MYFDGGMLLSPEYGPDESLAVSVTLSPPLTHQRNGLFHQMMVLTENKHH